MQKNFQTGIYPLLFITAFFGLLVLPLRTLQLSPQALEGNFFGREPLIKAVSDFRILIGDRVFAKVVVGKNNWLVFTAEHSASDYQNTIPFTEDELVEIQQSLDALNTSYTEQGIRLLVVIIPNKNTIYPEYVPDEIPVLGKESRLDQLMNYMEANGATAILDLRPTLLEAKPDHQLYYATDTHWNGYGVYLGYREIAGSLSETYPQIVVHPLSDFEIVYTEPGTLDMARNIGTSLLDESQVKLAPQFDTRAVYKTIELSERKLMFSSVPDPELPRAVVYYDSFFNPVIPLLGESFSRAVYIQNFTGGGLWSLSWVDEEQPDIVIIEFSERYLDSLPKLLKR
ncbi:MAG: hypothetical protein JXA13_03095 [Anaerolineales bacterium]|nr:hypothetical protein [Anaerolineales bacterium]